MGATSRRAGRPISWCTPPSAEACLGRFTLENRSGYSTRDLRRVIGKAFQAMGIRTPKRVTVVPSPVFSRGCAEVSLDKAGAKMVIAVSPPSYGTDASFFRRLGRLLEHECAHLKGTDHEAMPQRLLYSEGDTPRWIRGERIRYRGRPMRRRRRAVR